MVVVTSMSCLAEHESRTTKHELDSKDGWCSGRSDEVSGGFLDIVSLSNKYYASYFRALNEHTLVQFQ